MMSITKNTLSNSQRLRWVQATVALSFVTGIFFARQLFWNLHRSYPLAPVLQGLKAVPWADAILTALLVAALIMIAVARKPKYYLVVAVALTAFLFLEDQSRLFPSFYEYFLLLFVLACYAWQGDNEERAGRILNICRLAIAFIYFWSGAQKINPFFESQLSWVLAPVSNAIPLLQGNFIHWASVIAPFIEMEIGIGLLFKKTRNAALIEALLMHATLFLFIGPLRDPIHESAWIWNIASACLVFLLFFDIHDASAKEILYNFTDKNMRFIHAFIFLAFGILPAFNFINLWDSSLSFNVFSGNVAYAQIDVSPATLRQLPLNVQNYAIPPFTKNGAYELDINSWAESELGAEPSPEPRVLENIGKALCSYASDPVDIQITIYNKLTFFESPASRTIEHYTCP
jgi:hypothetical protein